MKYVSRIALMILLLTFLRLDAWAGWEVWNLPGLVEEITIDGWYVAGPFLGGPREPFVNILADSFDPVTGQVDISMDYPSVLENGGRVSWQDLTEDENGNLNFNFQNVDWDKINDEWGLQGIYFYGGAYTTFESEKRCRAIVNAQGLGTFYINGRQYSGDPYGHNLIQTPVILDTGVNHVFFMTGGFGGEESVRFDVLPAAEDRIIVLERDVLLPDLIRGEQLDSFAGIPIMNTSNEWVDFVAVVLSDSEPFVPISTGVVNMAPLSVQKLSVPIRTSEVIDNWEEDTYEINIRIQWPDGASDVTATGRVRNPEDSRIVTFQSRNDKSTQKYAVRYPVNYDPEREYSLIFTLHGAGVECEGQVDAYEPKDWAFIVAPTNRRNFGFDWQDWGRLDAIEILDLVMEKYPIDENRVYLTGHSMGGHGTWHVGTTHADRFAAIIPSAGWASFQTYIPWNLRTDSLTFDPELGRIFDVMQSPDRVERMLPNLRNTPVLVVHGGADDNVPPTHGRMLSGMLEQMGYDVAYWEEPEQGHWWDAHPGIEGADCVDALRIRSFMREHLRNPYPRHVTFVSYDISNNNSMYWVEVLSAENPLRRVYVDAEIGSDGVLKVETENVESIRFNIVENFPYDISRGVIIDGVEAVYTYPGIDGQEINWFDHPFFVTKVSDSWQIHLTIWSDKHDDYAGPIKRAYYNPFVIIVGTAGSQEENDLNLEIATNLSQRWWYRSNGYVRIVRDNQLSFDITGTDYNYILIGGPDSNLVSKQYSDSMPFVLSPDGITLRRFGSDVTIDGTDLALQYIYPRPDRENTLMHAIWGNSLEGMRLAGSLTCLYSGSAIPDFIVFDEDVRRDGLAGVLAAGMFENNWHALPDLMYPSDNSQHF